MMLGRNKCGIERAKGVAPFAVSGAIKHAEFMPAAIGVVRAFVSQYLLRFPLRHVPTPAETGQQSSTRRGESQIGEAAEDIVERMLHNAMIDWDAACRFARAAAEASPKDRRIRG